MAFDLQVDGSLEDFGFVLFVHEPDGAIIFLCQYEGWLDGLGSNVRCCGEVDPGRVDG